MPETMFSCAEAANAALRRALADETVIIFGEDVAEPGGVFGVTKNLRRDYGDRVFDTPISEAAILGAAVGAALVGLRPVAEIMWADFSLVALDQIVNQAANIRYCSNGKLSAPLTIRTQQGAMPGSCAQHSQCLESFFTHIPGLRVAAPATPGDAYEMLLAAVFSDDPAIVLESRRLYFGPKAAVDVNIEIPSVGGAKIVRPGTDATLVTWSTMLQPSLDAADELSAQGIDVEVIDARWLAPFDFDAVATSVDRTSRLLIVHEANLTGGFSGEIAARIAERAFYSLDAPVARLGARDTRMPAAPHLQAEVLPAAADIVSAVSNLGN